VQTKDGADVDDLDYRGPVERCVDDLVNSALSAFTDLFDDTIMEEELPEHRRGFLVRAYCSHKEAQKAQK
jgi:hypothetical protein